MNDTIYSINGPVVTLRGARGFSMMEMVYVGEVGLIGEVIGITSEKTTIQVYEDTAGLKAVSYTHLSRYMRTPSPSCRCSALLPSALGRTA